VRGGRLAAVTVVFAALCGASSAAAERERALLPLTLNHDDRGMILALVDGPDVWVRVGGLEAAGVHGFAGRRETIDGDAFVSLASLGEASYTLDRESVVLDLTVPPAWLDATVIDMSPRAPAGIVYSNDTSGFVNYAFNAREATGADAFVEGGLSVRGDLLHSSVSRAPEGRLARGLTSYTHDDRERLVRWVAGDAFASAGGLGGALFLGGLSVSRDFDLDPYFVRTPTMSFSGAVTTPSTIDVYVNGSIVRRQQIQPGTFDINSLALPSGTGNARVVVRDAFGQERTLSNPFYASAQLLARGLDEYSVNVGFRRDDIGSGSNGYGGPAGLAWQRHGWTDRFTSGTRVEADGDVVSLGASVTAQVAFGELEAEIAGSRDHGRAGSAASFVFRRLGPVVNFGCFIRAQDGSYANLSLRAVQDRPTVQGSAFIGAGLNRLTSLSAQYDLSEMRDAPRARRLSVSTTVSVARSVSLMLSGGAAELDGRTRGEAFAGLSWFIGHGTTASATTQRAGGASTTSVAVQKSLPLGTGLGYRVGVQSTEQIESGGASIQYQTSFGRYEARYEFLDGHGTPSISIAGGAVALGGTMALTAPVGESFALLRVPGVAGVTGLSSNQPIARTNRRGDVVIPNLMPYYGNRLGIVDQDVPIDYQLGATEVTVAPPYRGGAVVTFQAVKTRSIRGVLMIEVAGESVPAAYGEITVDTDGARFQSPLGYGGEFEFANLPPGEHTALAVSSTGATCAAPIRVPEGDQSVVDVGIVLCTISGQP
jgi:outer membrane usher protein